MHHRRALKPAAMYITSNLSPTNTSLGKPFLGYEATTPWFVVYMERCRFAQAYNVAEIDSRHKL